jgi:hypothetical protein
MRLVKVAALVGVTGCALGAGSVALAASGQTGGKIRVFVTNTSPTKGRILITGAIGDYGTTLSENANGKPNPNGNFEKVTLRHGGFIVNGTALNKVLNGGHPVVNKANCSVSFTGTGPTTVGNGTGAYAGISGKIAITVTFAGVGQKTAKGCQLNGKIGGAYQSITGSGTVSFK